MRAGLWLVRRQLCSFRLRDTFSFLNMGAHISLHGWSLEFLDYLAHGYKDYTVQIYTLWKGFGSLGKRLE